MAAGYYMRRLLVEMTAEMTAGYNIIWYG